MIRNLLADLVQALHDGRECVYCSVVETRGSTPQKAGAAMLVFPDGSQRGTLGGGCVEAEVKQRALRVLNLPDAGPELLSFNLDDNYGWDDGLICGGRMGIVAHPLRPNTENGSPTNREVRDYFRRFHEMVESGRGCTEAVIVTGQNSGHDVGSRFLFDADNHRAAVIATPNDGKPSSTDLSPKIADALQPLRRRPRPTVHAGIAYLPILPRITLFLVGGGHVGQAVAQLGAPLDFDIWVLDDRELYASAERFPSAQRRFVGDIGAQLQELVKKDIDPSVYCLILTRGHSHDEEALYHLAPSDAGYVGMIGSKRKIKLIYEDLIARGIPVEELERVHAPLGFAIGSQTVPEIAVSIVAELIACRNLGATIPEARVRVKPGTAK